MISNCEKTCHSKRQLKIGRARKIHLASSNSGEHGFDSVRLSREKKILSLLKSINRKEKEKHCEGNIQ